MTTLALRGPNQSDRYMLSNPLDHRRRGSYHGLKVMSETATAWEGQMLGSSRLRGWLIAQTTAIVLSTAGAIAAELNPAALVYQLPDQLKWRDPLGVSGVNQAVLHGDPTKPGLYVVLNRFKPGNFSRPHFH